MNPLPIHAVVPAGRRAAAVATRLHCLTLRLPVLGTVKLPQGEQLAYVGGLALLAGLGMLEWPVAAVLGAGHLLAADRDNKILADFGEALEQA